MAVTALDPSMRTANQPITPDVAIQMKEISALAASSPNKFLMALVVPQLFPHNLKTKESSKSADKPMSRPIKLRTINPPRMKFVMTVFCV